MAQFYRVYSLDHDRIVLRVRIIEAVDDDAALASAREIGWERMQIWTGSRLVSEIESGVFDPHLEG